MKSVRTVRGMFRLTGCVCYPAKLLNIQHDEHISLYAFCFDSLHSHGVTKVNIADQAFLMNRIQGSLNNLKHKTFLHQVKPLRGGRSKGEWKISLRMNHVFTRHLFTRSRLSMAEQAQVNGEYSLLLIRLCRAKERGMSLHKTKSLQGASTVSFRRIHGDGSSLSEATDTGECSVTTYPIHLW